MMSKELVDRLNEELAGKTTEEVVAFFLKNYKYSSALSSSLAAEDQVLTDIILKKNKDAKIFTLDTGRLHPETYDVMDATNLKYNIKLDVYFPNENDVQELYKSQGVNGQYESIENRKTCCGIRKIEPLKRALKGLDIWFTGLRAAQSVTRTDMKLVEWDEGFKLIKVNPLILWSEDDVWDYIKEHKVPYNKLHDKGFPSIGCAPCTRAVKDGEDIRAGRWWWENPEHKECGLHKK
ncbi:phosphoadenylyl-sulfate reductase [Poseidonibacter ostreae]|uniref:Adenosine 5'-phosphosulfate reductase n=1 Tax=Poseidonibacter ostreae TaxID=2654171 RepID=A0A6L4WUQ8_9BACT|nr:phosphoadenylyl-sulfate reductase [Poseidonibacter ostreae]KAB7884211.1 phosphoadenylyl-sulfate reductase [Poseidonibacter ostreae]KAB7889986.1 phosphoadenylyl-sulfate reductase [Poseidonibacter ostreae]KAB7891500.1 phosphoadenylyl-sulfate reductase [Poseidonibacter ostreae]